MEGRGARRLRDVGRALLPRTDLARTIASADVPAPAELAPHLLTSQQVKDFIVNGFVVLKVDELPAGFNDAFYEQAKELRDESRDLLWGELTPGVNHLLSTPTARGAISSLLGTDYFMPPGNSHMHIAMPGDQGFHKVSLSPSRLLVNALADLRPLFLLISALPGEPP